MVLKLNNPEMRTPKILRGKSVKTKKKSRRDKLPSPIWMPPDIRHTDFS
jgi:hypothetical protein